MSRAFVFSAILCSIVGIQMIFSCQSNLSVDTMQYAVLGKKLYSTHCQNCHGEKGEGLGMLYPPLTDTSYLKENRNILPCIIKNGISGPITVSGKTYNEMMPAIPQLTEIDIAYILTYVTTAFGDAHEKFSDEEVRKLLKECK